MCCEQHAALMHTKERCFRLLALHVYSYFERLRIGSLFKNAYLTLQKKKKILIILLTRFKTFYMTFKTRCFY